MTTRPLSSVTSRSDTVPELDPQLLRRVIVEAVEPQVDCGRFAVKRVVGEDVLVRADVHADGHDVVGAVVLFRRAGEERWRESPMRALDNDRMQGSFRVDALGRYEYTVEAWIDRFASWQRELSKKAGAGQDVSIELIEGAEQIQAAIDRSPGPAADERVATVRALKSGGDLAPRIAAALSDDVAAFMAARPDRSQATQYDRILTVTVERERARFAAWYEMFPRSAGTDPARSATFPEATSLLPYVAAMGFDVLYLPPIHPIGRSFRKGANNALTASPTDPGSPWAIGSEDGGHTAIEPGLGTIADFDAFVAAAAAQGLEMLSISRSRRRRITPTSANIPTGFASGRTARSSTPRTLR